MLVTALWEGKALICRVCQFARSEYAHSVPVEPLDGEGRSMTGSSGRSEPGSSAPLLVAVCDREAGSGKRHQEHTLKAPRVTGKETDGWRDKTGRDRLLHFQV